MMETALEITTEPLRSHLAALLSSEAAHAGFDAAVANLPVNLQGNHPAGAAHTPWQVLEHMRITQRDILNRIANAQYRPLKFPDEYWPPAVAPRKNESWDASVSAFRADQKALAGIVAKADLFGPTRPGADSVLLDDLLMIVDHNAYHLGNSCCCAACSAYGAETGNRSSRPRRNSDPATPALPAPC